MVVIFFGAKSGGLPHLPSDETMNIALFLNLAAYVSFCVFLHWEVKRAEDREANPTVGELPYHVGWSWALIFFILGAVGLYLKYKSPARFLEFLDDPLARAALAIDLEGQVEGVLSSVLIPFLPWVFVIIWGLWVRRQGGKWSGKGFLGPSVLLGIFVLASVFMNTGMNRNPIIVAFLSLLATYSIFCRPISLPIFLAFGITSFGIVLPITFLRSVKITSFLSVLKDSPLTLKYVGRIAIEQIQVYGGGPQFLGYILEQTDYGKDLYFGKTILASILQPLPLLGKPFREFSSVRIYNEMIYGSGVAIEDQIVPFQGELFINFHIVGILLGFSILGWIVAKLDRKFLESKSPVEGYCWFFASLWILFLITGSSAVVSQMFIVVFWPIYALFINRLRSGQRYCVPAV